MPQIGLCYDDEGNPAGPRVGCPRKDCSYEHDIRMGTKLYENLFGK